MLGVRVIPVLLLKGRGLVKTKQFSNPRYLGDPINTVRIFNDKEVDEIALLDIQASKTGSLINLELLEEIASQCFVPLAYGGGLHSLKSIQQILRLGFEKVILNSALLSNPTLITEASDAIGSQSVIASIDVKKNWLRKTVVYSHSKKAIADSDPVSLAVRAAELGAGEIVINSVDRDGLRNGYDTELIRQITSRVDVPVIASGGANTVSDLQSAVRSGGAAAAAAGSMFVFHGPHQAVLINFPTNKELIEAFPEREYRGKSTSNFPSLPLRAVA